MKLVKNGWIAVLSLTLAVSAFAAREFTMPKANPAQSYAAVDDHKNEKLAIAADAYETGNKQDEVFKTNFLENGYLPVFVVITNDGDVPVSLLDMKAQLVTRDRGKSAAATEEDLFRRLTSTKRIQDDSRGAKRLPIPVPSKPKRAVPKETLEEIQAAMFRAKVVEPHTTQSGFMFFDTGDLENPTSSARLYITGLKSSNGQELMYFEVYFEKQQ